MRVGSGLVVLVALVIAVNAGTRWYQLDNYNFEHYVQEFGKQYSEPEEYLFRKGVFETALAAIKLHNQDPTKTWKNGVNQYTDMTSEEFKEMAGYRLPLSRVGILRARDLDDLDDHTEGDHDNQSDDLPEFVDWTTHYPSIFSPVKDQGRCGSCWAFAAVTTIEAHLALATGKQYSLSPQHLVSCALNPNHCGGSGGCSGSTVQIAYEQAMTGLASIWTYPYVNYYNSVSSCQSKPAIQMNFTGYVNLPRNEELPLLQAVASVGPIAVSVSANGWHYYESGVYQASEPTINHAVVLVGYGISDDGIPYLKIRNSWGVDWGEEGHIRLARSTACATDTVPQDGTVCDGGPTTVEVCGISGVLYDSCYPLIYPFE